MFSQQDVYGTFIPNLVIKGELITYSVVNQREVRAGAGIVSLIAISSFFTSLFLDQFWLWYLVVPLFFWEYLLRVLVGPSAGPIAMISSLLVSSREPEWVLALPKRFSWMLSLIWVIGMIVTVLLFSSNPWIISGMALLLALANWIESVLDTSLGNGLYNACVSVGWVDGPVISHQHTAHTVTDILHQADEMVKEELTEISKFPK